MNDILIKQVEEILKEEDLLAVLCNLTALLNDAIPDINWVGFYLFKNNKLVLGPFQGKVACSQIEIGKGVCGSAFLNKQLLNVDNVHEFPGHIACDEASNSELVVPLIYNNQAFGVLDLDSKKFARFEIEEEMLLLKIAEMISKRMLDH